MCVKMLLNPVISFSRCRLVGDGFSAGSSRVSAPSSSCLKRPVSHGSPRCPSLYGKSSRPNVVFAEVEHDVDAAAKVGKSGVFGKPEASVGHRDHQVHVLSFRVPKSGQLQPRQEKDHLAGPDRKLDGQPVRRLPVRNFAAKHSGRIDDWAEEAGKIGLRPPPDGLTGRRQGRDHEGPRADVGVKRRFATSRVFVENFVDVVVRCAAQSVAQDVVVVGSGQQPRYFQQCVENSLWLLCM